MEKRPSCAQVIARSGPGPGAWRQSWPPATSLFSILHELVGDGPPQQPPERANRRPDVRPRVVRPPEAVHFAEAGHRLLRPTVDVPPLVSHAEQIPDDFLEVVGVWYRHDPHSPRLEHAVDLSSGLKCRRRVLEHLDHEDAVE